MELQDGLLHQTLQSDAASIGLNAPQIPDAKGELAEGLRQVNPYRGEEHGVGVDRGLHQVVPINSNRYGWQEHEVTQREQEGGQVLCTNRLGLGIVCAAPPAPTCRAERPVWISCPTPYSCRMQQEPGRPQKKVFSPQKYPEPCLHYPRRRHIRRRKDKQLCPSGSHQTPSIWGSSQTDCCFTEDPNSVYTKQLTCLDVCNCCLTCSAAAALLANMLS